MKKVLAIVLSVAMLACFAIPALAVDPATYTLTADTLYVQPGESFVATVSLTEGAMSSGNIYVEYDTEALTVSPIRDIVATGTGGRASGAANVLNNEEVVGIKYAMAFTYPSSSYGIEDPSLFTVNFTVPEDAAEGDTYEITLRVEDVVCARSETDSTTDPVEVTVSDPIVVTVGTDPNSTASTDSTTSVESTVPSTTPSTTTPSTSTNNPKTGDAGVAVFAAIVAAAAAAAFVAGKKKA